MSSVVDERIVRMQFDNNRFEKNIKSSMNLLDLFKKKTEMTEPTKGLTGFIDKIKNLGNTANNISFDRLYNNIDQIASRFSTTGIAVTRVIENITDGVMSLSTKLLSFVKNGIITGGINRAMGIENATFMLQGLFKGDTNKVNNVLAEAKDSVNETAYALNEAAAAAAQLSSSGVKALGFGDPTKFNESPMYKALRGIAGVAGTTNAEYSRVSQIFTTVAGNGRLMGDQLLQFSSMGLNAAATLKDYFIQVKNQANTTEESVRDMVSKGKIDFETFSEAMNWAFGDQAKKANDTINGVISNIKAALAKIGASFVSPLVVSKGPLVKFFNVIRGELSDIVNTIGFVPEKLIPDIKKGLKWLRFEIGVIDSVKITKDIGEASVNAWKSVKNIISYVSDAIKPVKIAFKDIFGDVEIDTEDIKKASMALKEWTKTLSVSDKFKNEIGDTFKNVFSFVKDGLSGLKSVNTFSSILKSIKNTFGNVSSGIVEIFKAISETMGVIDSFTMFETLGKGLKGFFNILESGSKGLQGALFFIADFIKNMNKIDFSVLSNGLKIISEIVSSLINSVSSLWDKFSGGANVVYVILQNVWGVLSYILSGITTFFKKNTKIKLDWKGIFGIAEGSIIISILYTVYNVLSKIFFITKHSGAVVDDFKRLFSGFKNNILKALTSITTSLQKMEMLIDARIIKEIAISVGILAASCYVLATLPLSKLAQGFTIIIAFFSEAMRQMQILSTMNAGTKSLFASSLGAVIVQISAAVLILSIALKNVGKLDPDKALVGFTVIEILLVTINEIMRNFYGKSIENNIKDVGKTILLMSASIYVISSAIKKIGKLDPEQALIGLLVVEALLYTINRLVSGKGSIKEKNIKDVGKTILLISASIYVMAQAIKQIGNLPIENAIVSILAVEILLFTINRLVSGKGSIQEKNITGVAAAILIISAAIYVMSSAVKKMSGIPIKSLAKGLAAMEIVLWSLYLFSVAAKKAGSFSETAASIVLLSTGLLLLSGALQVFSDLDHPVQAILVFTSVLASLIATVFAIGVINEVIPTATVSFLAFSSACTLLGVAVLFIGSGVYLAAKGILYLAKAIKKIASIASEDIPKFIKNMKDIISPMPGFLAEIAVSCIISFITAIGDNASKIVTAAANAMDKFATALNDPENQEKITNSGNIIMEKLCGAIADRWEAFKYEFSEDFKEYWGEKLTGFLDDLAWFFNGHYQEALKTKEIMDRIKAQKENGKNVSDGLVEGVKDGNADAYKAGHDQGEAVIQGVKDGTKSKSPSRAAMEVGKYVGEGLAIGIKNNTDKPTKEATKIGKSVIKSMQKSFRNGDYRYSINVDPDVKITNNKKHIDKDFEKVLSKSLDIWGKRFEKNFNERVKINPFKSLKTLAIESQREVTNEMYNEFQWYRKMLKDSGKKVEETVGTMPNIFKTYIENSKSSSKYAKKQVQEFTKVFGTSTKQSASVLDVFAKRLYMNSDAYSESTSNLKEYTANLRNSKKILSKQKTELTNQNKKLKNLQSELVSNQSELNKYGSDTSNLTDEQKSRVNELKSIISKNQSDINATQNNIKNSNKEIKQLKKDIKNEKKVISKEAENLAKGPKRALKAYKNELKEAYKSLVNINNLNFSTIINGFSGFSKTTNLVDRQINALTLSFNKFSKDFQNGVDNVASSFDILGASIDTGINKFDKFEKVSKVSAKTLIKNFKSQLKAQEEFVRGIDKLRSMGFSDSLIKELEAEGPQAIGKIKGFLSMSASQVSEYNRMIQKEEAYQSKALERGLSSQLDTFDKFNSGIEKLRASGIDEGFINAIKNSGVSEANVKYINAILGADKATIEKLNKDFKSIIEKSSSTEEVQQKLKEAAKKTAKSWLEAMEIELAEYDEFYDKINKLREAGLSESIIKELEAAGYNASSDIIEELMDAMTKGELSKYNELFAKTLTKGKNPLDIWAENVTSRTNAWKTYQNNMNQIRSYMTSQGPSGLTFIRELESLGWEEGSEYAEAFVKADEAGRQKIMRVMEERRQANRDAVKQSLIDRLSDIQYAKDLISTYTSWGLTGQLGDDMLAWIKEGNFDMLKAFNEMFPSQAEFQEYMVSYNTANSDIMSKSFANTFTNAAAAINVSEYEHIGENIIDGLIRGIEKSTPKFINAIIDVNKKGQEAAQKANDSHSPSRVYEKFGYNIVDGLVIGVSSGADMLAQTMRSLSEQMQENFDYISDYNPTITPTLDLSYVMSEAANLSALMEGFNQNYSASVNANGEDTNQNGMTFIQNNYSPESLSTAEIYRQTNNMFATASRKAGMR